MDASKSKDKRFFIELGLWSRMPTVRRFIYESPAAEIARSLLRTRKLNLFFDQLFVKEPGAVEPTPWHQDQPYWTVAGRQVLSLWIPMDPVTLSSGGIEYVRGSHEWNRRFHPVAFGPSTAKVDKLLSALDGDDIPDIDADRSRHDFLSWDMAPGDVLVHQAMTIHGASGNGVADTAPARLFCPLDGGRRDLGSEVRHPGNHPRTLDASLSHSRRRSDGQRSLPRHSKAMTAMTGALAMRSFGRFERAPTWQK